MKTSDFFYDLPQELIAQKPVEPRDSSRLMVLDKTTGEVEHKHFYDICDYLEEGDCLILNDTRVLPARIYGVKEGTGAHVEFLLLNHVENDVWEVLAGPGKRAKEGTQFTFGDGIMRAKIIEVLANGNRIAQFSYEGSNFYDALDRVGEMPLPHYITEKLENKERYQTVYSRELGSAAAPTAGLHFTPELLREIAEMGVKIAHVTLHVGLGTFRPVKVEDVTEHHMHTEYYEIEEEQAALINETKAKGGRIICVGTTSCRTLESASDQEGILHAGSGWTDIFIYPGYRFKIMDGLITNFHLPESTLIMLVSAFAGKEKVFAAYEEAVRERYRFFSFGDAMLIL